MHIITPLDVWIVAIVSYLMGISAGCYIMYASCRYHKKEPKTTFQSLGINIPPQISSPSNEGE